MGYIYKITNTVNGKCYIGQTIQKLECRISEHCRRKTSHPLHNAIQKYGRDAFTVEILHEVLDIFLDDLEIAEIKKHNTLVPHGYNLDGGGNPGKYRSPETCKKISEAAKGRKYKPLSPEHRRKISEAAKGRKRKPFSPEHRKKISEAGKGRKHSPKTRKKISESHKGKTRSHEHCKKLSEANKGRKHSPKTRKKISDANKRRKYKPLSPEHRRKLSEAGVHPDRPKAYEILNSLPERTPLTERRKILRNKFPEQHRGTIYDWVKQWSETTSSSCAPSDRHIVFEILNSLPESMSLAEKRGILREKFPEIQYGTIHYWVKKWSETTTP